MVPGGVHERPDVGFSSPSHVDHKKAWMRTIVIMINKKFFYNSNNYNNNNNNMKNSNNKNKKYANQLPDG